VVRLPPISAKSFASKCRICAVDVAPNGDVFAGDSCGKLYRRLASTGAWSEIHVPTSSHIVSISIVSVTEGGYSVYLGCYRIGEEMQVILKY
jgi:hypothetical protein